MVREPADPTIQTGARSDREHDGHDERRTRDQTSGPLIVLMDHSYHKGIRGSHALPGRHRAAVRSGRPVRHRSANAVGTGLLDPDHVRATTVRRGSDIDRSRIDIAAIEAAAPVLATSVGPANGAHCVEIKVRLG